MNQLRAGGDIPAIRWLGEFEENRGKVNALMEELPKAIAAGEHAVAGWFGKFAELNKDPNISVDAPSILNTLEKAGYSEVPRPETEALRTDSSAHAKWVVGQSIEALRTGNIHNEQYIDTAITNAEINARFHAGNTRDQKAVDTLVSRLPDAIREGDGAIMKWVSDFAIHNDSSSVKFNAAEIGRQLQQAGYEKTSYSTEEMEGNPDKYAKSLIGDAADTLASGHRLNPGYSTSARRYEQMTAPPKTVQGDPEKLIKMYQELVKSAGGGTLITSINGVPVKVDGHNSLADMVSDYKGTQQYLAENPDAGKHLQSPRPLYEFYGHIGSSITENIEKSKTLSSLLGHDIVTGSADARVTVNRGSDSEKLLQEYRVKAYAALEPPPELVEKWNAEVHEAQQKANKLISDLPNAIKGGEAEVVRWLGEFSEVSDRNGISFDSKHIAETLKSAGYDPSIYAQQKTSPTPSAPESAPFAVTEASHPDLAATKQVNSTPPSPPEGTAHQQGTDTTSRTVSAHQAAVARLSSSVGLAGSVTGTVMGLNGIYDNLSEGQSLHDIQAGGVQAATAGAKFVTDGADAISGVVGSADDILTTAGKNGLGVAGKIAGRAAVPLAIVSGVLETSTALAAGDDKRAAGAVGGTIGGIAGGLIVGAGAGFVGGTVVPGPGNVIGTVAGGLVGGVAGGMYGEEVAREYATSTVTAVREGVAYASQVVGDTYNATTQAVSDAAETVQKTASNISEGVSSWTNWAYNGIVGTASASEVSTPPKVETPPPQVSAAPASIPSSAPASKVTASPAPTSPASESAGQTEPHNSASSATIHHYGKAGWSLGTGSIGFGKDSFYAAAATATKNNTPVALHMGEKEIQVAPNADPSKLYRQYADQKLDSIPKLSIEEEKVWRRAQAREQMAKVVEELPAAIKGGKEELVKWAGKFHETEEYVAGGYDKKVVIDQLATAGYDGKNTNPKWASTSSIKENPDKEADSIINRVVANVKGLGNAAAYNRGYGEEIRDYLNTVSIERFNKEAKEKAQAPGSTHTSPTTQTAETQQNSSTPAHPATTVTGSTENNETKPNAATASATPPNHSDAMLKSLKAAKECGLNPNIGPGKDTDHEEKNPSQPSPNAAQQYAKKKQAAAGMGQA